MGKIKSVTSPEIVAQKKKLSDIIAAVNNSKKEEQRIEGKVADYKKEAASLELNIKRLQSSQEAEEKDLAASREKTLKAKKALNDVLCNISSSEKTLSDNDAAIQKAQLKIKQVENSYNKFIESIEMAKKDMLNEFLNNVERIKSLMW